MAGPRARGSNQSAPGRFPLSAPPGACHRHLAPRRCSVLSGTGPRGGKAVEQTMTTRAQEAYAGKRARKGKTLEPKLREPKLSLPKPAPEAA